jgi:uncharacterized protein
MADSDPDDPPVIARIVSGVSTLPAAQWDALVGSDDPFLSHAFLSLLEQSGSVGPGTGWQPALVLIDGDDGTLAAAAPAYLKSHSQGEYVFDHGWADAFERAGGSYYPKLQVAVPFTPVPGRRLLARDNDGMRALIAALEAVTVQNGLSSAHATFVAPDQLPLFESAGWLIRCDNQFHWFDRGYGDFNGFLGALSSRKRKDIRKERESANAAAQIETLTGDAIRPHHWDLMWACYQDTGTRKWGTPYLTRDAFALLGDRLADRVMLAVATDRTTGQPVAAAMNLIGADALYGRYWGCLADIPALHFELCYYRAIDFALANRLSRVEAGAQGSHKLARGYEPVSTWSAHYIPHRGFRAAIADFLARETAGVEQDSVWLAQRTPFKKAD